MIVKPYGERPDDGIVQLSFAIPIPKTANPKQVARRLLFTMGMTEPSICHCEQIGDEMFRFVAYAKTACSVETKNIEAAAHEIRSISELNALIEQHLGRKLVIVGATIGSDAHTVGLDSILNAKGYAGSPGLERYSGFTVHNLGSQVPSEELIRHASIVSADAILISQIVTHNEGHRRNLREFRTLMKCSELSPHMTVVVGGPRVSEELAIEMGFDAAFGAGTTPSEVADTIVTLVLRKKGFNG